MIEAAYLGKDGEGRIVEHDAPFGIMVVLVIAAGEERAHDLHPVKGEDIVAYPLFNRLIHFRRGVAVVGGLLWLEFLHEALVVVENFLASTHP